MVSGKSYGSRFQFIDDINCFESCMKELANKQPELYAQLSPLVTPEQAEDIDTIVQMNKSLREKMEAKLKNSAKMTM